MLSERGIRLQIIQRTASPPCFVPLCLSVVGKADDPASLSERAPFCERYGWMDRTAHPVVLVVPPGDRQPRLLLALLLVGRVGVVAMERSRRPFVLQLSKTQFEL